MTVLNEDCGFGGAKALAGAAAAVAVGLGVDHENAGVVDLAGGDAALDGPESQPPESMGLLECRLGLTLPLTKRSKSSAEAPLVPESNCVPVMPPNAMKSSFSKGLLLVPAPSS